MPLSAHIQAHYSRPELGELILSALQNAGKDIDRLTAADLAAVDEFHIRGRAATLELARAARVKSSHKVLDVGSGLGGAARCLAAEFGCHVTGIDLSGDYCRVATMLSERVGLSSSVEFRQGNALELPFENGSFDVVWTVHAAMNIQDKPKLYREMHRVLKPGGTLAIYDIVAGPTTPVYFPVPWAREPATSFLAEPGELRSVIEREGFTVAEWTDATDGAREWFTAMAGKIRTKGLPPLGLHVLLGEDFKDMAQNQRRNLEEGRIGLAQIIATRSAIAD